MGGIEGSLESSSSCCQSVNISVIAHVVRKLKNVQILRKSTDWKIF
jgi:hypothetical protein